MKRVNWKPVVALALICLPLIFMVGIVQKARRADAAQRRQNALNVTLFHATQRNEVSEVEALLAQGASANARVQMQQTRSIDIAECQIEGGAV